MSNRCFALRAAASAGLFATLAVAAHAQLLGPSAYLKKEDSPFFGGSFTYFHLEDFEDHTLDVPGVTADAGGVSSIVFGPTLHDSVDADDGAIDGSGLRGDDYYSSDANGGVTWTFDEAALGHLPTHVGIVWTDGLNNIHFEAWDQNGVSLGTLTGTHANNTLTGETDEDRFYGAIHSGGISKIHLSGEGGGIEMDHLQYGYSAVPEPATYAGMVAGCALLFGRRRRRG